MHCRPTPPGRSAQGLGGVTLGWSLLCISMALGCGAPSPEPGPNFVVIFLDDLGYGDIGPFGSSVNETPSLDRMAAEGMKLTSFYSAAPVCTPSRAGLLTGSYPKRVGMADGPEMRVLFTGEPWGLSPAELTIAELLRARGYATGCFGKWHLGDQPVFLPTEHGFDEYFGIPYSNDMWPLHSQYQEGGPFDFPHLPLMRGTEVVGEVTDMRGQADLCRLFTEETVGFIRRNRDRPFFAYVPHAFIHHPRAASEHFMERVEGSRDSIDWTAVTTPSGPWHCTPGAGCRPGSMSDSEWLELARRRTRAQVEEVDWSVGRILDTLEELGIADRTLVVFTSDNGGSFGSSNGPLRGSKGSTWEGGMRVPALAWWPGSVPAGSVSGEVSSVMDLLPTFTALAGGALPADRRLDGRDLSALLLAQEGTPSPDREFFYFREEHLEAVRLGRWKLFSETGELYDLESDIGESRDVASQHPEVVDRLRGLLAEAAADLGTGPDSCPRCRPVGVVENPRTLLPRLAHE